MPAGAGSDVLIFQSEYQTPRLKSQKNSMLMRGDIFKNGDLLLKAPSSSEVFLLQQEGKKNTRLKAPKRTTLNGPVKFGRDGKIYAMDLIKGHIVVFDNSGKFEEKILFHQVKKDEASGNFSLFISPEDNIYVIENKSGTVYRFNIRGDFEQKFRLERSGYFSQKIGFSSDPDGNTYFLDRGKKRIYKFNSGGDEEFKIKGAGRKKFVGPLYFSPSVFEKFFVLDSGAHKIYTYSDEGEFQEAFGEKGRDEGEFLDPIDIVVDTQGNVFVCDIGNNRIQIYDVEGNAILEFGKETGEESRLEKPSGIFLFQEKFLFVLEGDYQTIKTLTPDGAYKAFLSIPKFLKMDYNDDFCFFADDSKGLYAVNKSNGKIIRYNPALENFNKNFKSLINNQSPIDRISNLAFDSIGMVYYIDKKYKQVQVCDTNGKKIRKFKTKVIASKIKPRIPVSDMECDENGDFYIADPKNHVVKKIKRQGQVEWVAGKNNDRDRDGFLDAGKKNGEFNRPFALRLYGNDKLLVADYGNYRIQILNRDDGKFKGSFGKKGFKEGLFSVPFSLFTDGKRIFQTDTSVDRIQGFNAKGDFLFSQGSDGRGHEEFTKPFISGTTSDNSFLIIDAEPQKKFGNRNQFGIFRVQKLKLENLINNGLALLKKQNFAGAAKIFHQITRTPRDSGDIRYYLGYCFLKEGEIDKGKSTLQIVDIKKREDAKKPAAELLNYLKNSGY
ncbi:NHL repeat-containing protein [Candidatus Riflebacteria bacterium]